MATKNFTSAQLKDILEIHENTIMKMFIDRIEKLENKLKSVIDENKKLKKELRELNKAVEFVSNNYDKIVADHQTSKTSLINENANSKMINKLAELEDRSRRNNLRFCGIEEIENESWEDSENKVREFLNNKLQLHGNFEIERAYRVGKKLPENNKKNRSIVVRFLNYKDKATILRKYTTMKLWTQKVYINEDYGDHTLELRKKLLNEAKDLRAKGKYAKVV
ncbi:uncharacterized protein LOC136077015 isoform X2 [Hydra vulgaris]|uniref:Uncharacterized protein LOC136077015 isoform X2 n=1 Tax=Hydra vulgaris TaxID=6087 RepID=A0ABM4BEE1_HYDVU